MSDSLLSARRRATTLTEVTGGAVFDLLVVGGGINGAGIAHDAALRGLKVCLVEQRDLAFGTSSRSSKLIHGGLRYLEHYHFRLVFEGTNERALLRKLAPHLVRPLLFALPVYETDRHPRWKIEVGMWLYDGLSLFKTEHRHVSLRSAKRLLEREPLLRSDGLTGGIIYYDCLTDDARLTLENAIAAARLGTPILTQTKLVGLEGLHDKNGPVTATVVDQLTGREHKIKAKGVVNASGVWTDSVRRAAKIEGSLLRPTKGVHVVLPKERLPVSHAVAMIAPQDGRVFFAIPWNGRTVIGTTDTDDHQDPSSTNVTMADVEYLLSATNHAFPSAALAPGDVIAAWAGLRPLIKAPEAENASAVPREHQVFRDGRMVSIAGGKLTTYRRMAAETVDAAIETIAARAQESTTAQAKLPGAIGLDVDLDVLAARITEKSGVATDVANRLAHVYGVRAFGVLEQIGKVGPDRVTAERDVLVAEVAHAIDHELALTLEDVMVRRTSLALTARDQGRGSAERVADLMASKLGWDLATKRKNLDDFERAVNLTVAFRNETAPR